MHFRFVIIILASLLFSSCMNLRIAQNDASIQVRAKSNEHKKQVAVSNGFRVPLPLFLARPFIRAALKEENAPKEVLRLVNKVHMVNVVVLDREGGMFKPDPISWAAFHPRYESMLQVKRSGLHMECWSKIKRNRIKGFKLILDSEDGPNVALAVKCNISVKDLEKVMAFAME